MPRKSSTFTFEGTIGFIGGGNMAKSLVGGLVSKGFHPSSIFVYDPMPEAMQFMADQFGVQLTDGNDKTIANSSIVVLAVKPQVSRSVLNEARHALQERRPLLISIAAGIQIKNLDLWSGGGLAIVRVMPNTPALIQRGMTALHPNSRVSKEQLDYAERILSAVGKTARVQDESDLDAVTALSGSGPAYFFFLIEAMEQAAQDMGIDSSTAHILATETAVGAGLLAAGSDESAAALRKRVTSPGGVTEAAFQVLENARVKDSWVEAIIAGQHRSIEMSKP